MKLLMTASQIRGLPVVTTRGGEDVAEVRDVIYNPEAGRLVGSVVVTDTLALTARAVGDIAKASSTARQGSARDVGAPIRHVM